MGTTNAYLSGNPNGLEFVRSTTAGNCYGVIWQNNTLGYLNVNCVLENGRSGSSQYNGLVQAGPGTVVYAEGNYYELSTYLNGGFSVITADTGLGQTNNGINAVGTIYMNGGTVVGNATFTMDQSGSALPRPFILAGNGGGLAATAGNKMTIDGLVSGASGTGPLTIGIPASSANGNTVGLLPGSGAGTGNPTAVYATGTVVLTNANSYYGGTILQSGTLNINGINALGGANYGGLTFNGGTLQYATAFSGNGSGDLTSIGAAGVTVAAGGGTIDLNGNTVTYAGSIGNNGSGALTVKSTAAGGVLNLQGANTYTGNTTNNGVTLNINGSLPGSVIVNNGGTNGGSGTISGSVTVNSGGATLPGTTGVTNTIGGNLTYNTGASANFDLTSSATGGGNDQIILNGTSSVLTCGNVSVGINCGSVLDETHDYLLFNLTGGSASISGNFNSTPVWLGTQPGGFANFSVVVTNSTQVVLHYAGSTPPAITATNASPNPVLANQSLAISATVVAGSGTVTNVSVNLSSISGPASQALISNGAGQYTNSIVIGSGIIPGSYTLAVLALDNLGGSVGVNISLSVSASSETWNGAATLGNSNWSDGVNWASGLAPGYGDSLIFAGGTGLTPLMDQSYNSIASVTFSNNAGSFNISNSGGSVLTLVGGVTNNSANAQTLNVPVALGAAVALNAASGNLVLGGAISGSGGLTTAGANTNILSGVNTFNNNTTISSGTLAIGGAGQLGSGAYAGNITNNGTFTYNSSAAQILSGVISGAGALNQNGSGMLTLAGVNTFTGTTVVGGGTLTLGNSLALQASTLNYNNQGGTLSFGTLTAATLGALVGAQNLIFANTTPAAVTLTVTNNNTVTTYSGNLNDSGLGSSLILGVTGGTNILTGTNTYGGATTIYTGTLQLSAGSELVGGSSLTVGSSAVPSGAPAFHLTGGTVTNGALGVGATSGSPPAGTVTIDSGTAVFTSTTIGGNNNGGVITINGGTVSLGAFLDKRDASVGTATYNQGLVIKNGTVTASSVIVSSGNSGGDLTISNGSLTIGNSSTTGGFEVGTGSSTLRGGFLTVGGGTLTYNGTDGLLINNSLSGAGNAAFTGGTSTLTGITLNESGSTAGSAILTISGSAAVYLGSVGLVTNPGGATATINLTGGILGAATNWSSSLSLTLGGTTIQAADAFGVAHNITLSGGLGGTTLTKTGNGTLTLNSAGNFYTGLTTINAGTLNINSEYALGGANYAGLTFNGGTLQYASNLLNSVTDVSTKPVSLIGNGTIDVNGNAINFANPIGNNGTGGLTVESSVPNGALTLQGANTYTGATIVSNGTLMVNGSLGSGAVTNEFGATLGGIGTIGGNVNWSAGSFALFTNGSPLTISGNVTLNTNIVTVAVPGLTPLAAGTYTLMTYNAAGSSGAFNATPTFAGAGLANGNVATVVTGSGTVSLVVNTTTTTALASSENPSGFKDSINFSASVTPATATGTVQFLTNGVLFDTEPLSGGSATSVAMTVLPRGTQIITAQYSGGGFYLPSTNTLSQVVTNHPPVAGNVSYSLQFGSLLKIQVGDLLTYVTDADGDPITLTGVGVSTNGITPTSDGTHIFYQNTNHVNDQFNYAVSDGFGGSATGTVTVVVSPFLTGQSATMSVGASTVTVNFAGIPGYAYGVQRSTNLVNWVTLETTNAPATGAFSYTDDFSDLGVVPSSAYYQLEWNP